MIEQLLQNHLEELRVIRENANRPRTEEDAGPDGEDEGEEGGGGDEDEDEDDDLDLDLDEVFVPGGVSGVEQPPSNPQTRERPRSPPEEYHGMYS